MKKLDLLDKKILYELDINSRISLIRLAKKLSVSREVVNYRITKLVDQRYIRKFVTMINPSKFGYLIYKLFFKFQNLDAKTKKQMLLWLRNNDYVYWIADCQGRWDMNITIFANDVHHFDEILSNFITYYGKYVLEQQFNITLEVNVLNKQWILPSRDFVKLVLVGGKVKDLEMDKLDVDILKILANNARISAVDIANKLGSNPRVILYRIKELENKGIILGYTVSLKLDVMGKQFFKSIIYFNALDKKTKKKVEQFCKVHPSINYFIFCVGNWPLELELVVDDNTQYYKIMDDFRDNFPEMKGYDTIFLPKEHKFDWMPLCYEVVDKGSKQIVDRGFKQIDGNQETGANGTKPS